MHLNLYQPFSLLITISLIYLPISFCEEHEDQYESCGKLFNCGRFQNVGYPFYGEDRPKSCGFPGFELDCEDDLPYIEIGEVTYRVLSIEQDTQVLKVARKDLYNDLCPQFLYNTSLDFRSLNYDTDDKNITLYYGCSPNPDQSFQQPNQFNCSVNGTTSFSFYLTQDALESRNLSMVRCKDKIIAPVTQEAAQSLGNLKASADELKKALAGGFGLKWFANDSNCDQCTRAGGRCGCNPLLLSFVCYCTNGTYPLTCNSQATGGGKKRDDMPLGVGLGIAGAVVAGIGIGGSIFFCRQRRKRVAAQAAPKTETETESNDVITTPKKAFNAIHSNSFTKSIPSYPSPKSDLGRGSSYFGVQVFSYSDLQVATDNFHPSKQLGDGGFGAVYHGTLPDGRVVAVKRLYENNFKRVEQFMNEVQILARLRHKNLVKLYGCTSKRSQELLLVYEFIPNGTVADHLHGKRANSGLLSWPVRMNIAVESAEALAYLHASDIIHRDVKTTNILLDNNFHVKVADFGLSRLFPTDVTHVSTAPQGTPGYVDPEYYQCYQLTEKSDVYSFGVVLIELISSLQAVDTNRHRNDINLANMAINKIQNHSLNELVDRSLGFETNSSVRRMATLVAELAFRCLQQERDSRPSMQEVLEALRGIQNGEFNAQKPEELEIVVDDVALLMNGSIDTPSTNSAGTAGGT